MKRLQGNLRATQACQENQVRVHRVHRVRAHQENQVRGRRENQVRGRRETQVLQGTPGHPGRAHLPRGRPTTAGATTMAYSTTAGPTRADRTGQSTVGTPDPPITPAFLTISLMASEQDRALQQRRSEVIASKLSAIASILAIECQYRSCFPV
jgi:hypothetical protein